MQVGSSPFLESGPPSRSNNSKEPHYSRVFPHMSTFRFKLNHIMHHSFSTASSACSSLATLNPTLSPSNLLLAWSSSQFCFRKPRHCQAVIGLVPAIMLGWSQQFQLDDRRWLRVCSHGKMLPFINAASVFLSMVTALWLDDCACVCQALPAFSQLPASVDVTHRNIKGGPVFSK